MRKEIQKRKDEKWEMIGWLTKFIEENKEGCEREKRKRNEDGEMTICKREKMKRFEKIEEIKKRRENAEKTPDFESSQLWTWRENERKRAERTPYTTPQAIVINCMLQDRQRQETTQTAAAASTRVLSNTVARTSQNEMPTHQPATTITTTPAVPTMMYLTA